MRPTEPTSGRAGAATCSFCAHTPSHCPYLGTACSDVWRGDPLDIPVVAAVARNTAGVLICQRKTGKRHALLWEFPGGKLLPGETLGEAVERELAEELELEVGELGRYLGCHRDPGARFVIHFVEARVAGEPALHEHRRVAWVAEAELASYPLAPGDRAFVEAWLKRE